MTHHNAITEEARQYLFAQARDIRDAFAKPTGYGFILLDRLISELDDLPIPGNQSIMELTGYVAPAPAAPMCECCEEQPAAPDSDECTSCQTTYGADQ